MELETYKDTLESIITDFEVQKQEYEAKIIELYSTVLSQRDYILELEAQVQTEKKEKQKALNELAEKEANQKMRAIKEYEKMNESEKGIRFTKVYPGGVKKLTELKQEGKLTSNDIGKCLLMLPMVQKDTNLLVDPGGNCLNKSQIAKAIHEGKSNLEISLSRLRDCGVLIEVDKDGKKAYKISDSVAYNGINRLNGRLN